MRFVCTSLFALITVASFLSADEPEKAKPQSPEEIVKAGIMRHYERMGSDDAKVREEEFDAVLPDEKTFEMLFGEDAKLIWPRFSEVRKKVIAINDKAKEEIDRMGKIVSVKLIDIRKDDDFGRYTRVLETIPKDVPVYRAVLQFEKSTGGSSCYVVIDGRMRYVRGLDGMVKFIDEQKKAKQ